MFINAIRLWLSQYCCKLHKNWNKTRRGKTTTKSFQSTLKFKSRRNALRQGSDKRTCDYDVVLFALMCVCVSLPDTPVLRSKLLCASLKEWTIVHHLASHHLQKQIHCSWHILTGVCSWHDVKIQVCLPGNHFSLLVARLFCNYYTGLLLNRAELTNRQVHDWILTHWNWNQPTVT